MTKVISRVAASVAAAVLGIAGASLAAAPANASSYPIYNCSSEHVCLYNGTTNTSGIVGIYWAYGASNLSGMYNQKSLMNNQVRGAWVYECLNYGGTNCTFGFASPLPDTAKVASVHITNFTPINSLRLSATSGSW
jgi:hypothetical protein